MSPGWIPFYTCELRTDAEGGLLIVFPMLRNICKDYNGGCVDGDGDGFDDSTYIDLSMGGQGIMHIYSPDPMSGEDNWTASLLHDMALDYEAEWFVSDIITLFHDGDSDFFGTMQYFYPNITMSAESDGTMWFAISGMSDYYTIIKFDDYTLDNTLKNISSLLEKIIIHYQPIRTNTDGNIEIKYNIPQPTQQSEPSNGGSFQFQKK